MRRRLEQHGNSIPPLKYQLRNLRRNHPEVGVDLVAVGEDPVAEGHLEILAVEVHLEAPVMEGHLKAQAVEMHLEARAVEMHLEVRAAEMHLEARTVEMHLEAQAVETTPVDREEVAVAEELQAALKALQMSLQKLLTRVF